MPSEQAETLHALLHLAHSPFSHMHSWKGPEIRQPESSLAAWSLIHPAVGDFHCLIVAYAAYAYAFFKNRSTHCKQYTGHILTYICFVGVDVKTESTRGRCLAVSHFEVCTLQLCFKDSFFEHLKCCSFGVPRLVEPQGPQSTPQWKIATKAVKNNCILAMCNCPFQHTMVNPHQCLPAATVM